jgi:hypothetical protein
MESRKKTMKMHLDNNLMRMMAFNRKNKTMVKKINRRLMKTMKRLLKRGGKS